MTARDRTFAISAALALVAVVAGAALLRRAADTEPPRTAEPPAGARLPSLIEAAGWLNGGPLTADSLRGNPAVVVFWSDTDPRSLSALPVVQSWHRAFRRYGVRVVGVYAPDYSFGADPEVPARAARRLGLDFPIALDPRYRILVEDDPGRPIVLVADSSGRVVFRGHGDRLTEADLAIREQVRSLRPEIRFPADPGAPFAALAAPVAEPRFVFLGTSRAVAGPLAGAQPGRTLTFTTQFRFLEEGEPLVPYPVGRWTPSAEGLTAARGGAMNFVAIRCPGGRASVVLRPPAEGAARVWILEDDAWLGEAARGEDVRVDARGASYVEVAEPRLYRIAELGAERVLKLSPEERGITFYAFAFEARQGEAEGPAGGGTVP